jgi:ComF family protein
MVPIGSLLILFGAPNMLNSVRQVVKKYWHKTQDAVFPRFCVACKNEGQLLCDTCRAQWPSTVQIEKRHAYSSRYSDPVARDLLQAWKYHFDEDGWRSLQQLMVQQQQPLREWVKALEVDVIVPIPLHRERFSERGFDQAVMIARHLGQLVGIPVSLALERTKATKKQADTPLSDRKTIVASNPFRLRRTDLQGKIVLLVDDVFTTGSTVKAAQNVVDTRTGKSYIYTLLKG